MNTLSTLGFIGLSSASIFPVLLVLASLSIFCIVALPLAHSGSLGLTAEQKKLTAEFSPDTFATQIKELESTVNAMLEGMPPLEQYENAAELSFAFRCLKQNAANFITLSQNLAAKAGAFFENAKASAEANAEAALIAKGDYVKKTDAQAAQEAAVTAAESRVKADLQLEQTATAECEARRAKLVEDKVVVATVAAAIPADFFKADGFDDRKAKLTARVAKLTEAKLTTEDFLAEMVALPFDEAGEKAFTARLASTQSLVAATASRSSGGINLAGLGGKKEAEVEVVAFF